MARTAEDDYQDWIGTIDGRPDYVHRSPLRRLRDGKSARAFPTHHCFFGGRRVQSELKPLAPLGVVARYTRVSVLEVLNADHVRTAWAKGLNARRVVLRSAMIPPKADVY